MNAFAPGPRGHMLFGCSERFRNEPLALLNECRQRYGTLVRLPVGFGASFCLAFDPADLDTIFQGENFGRSDIAAAFGPLAGGSMIIADGQKWKEQRKAVIPSFALPRLRALAQNVDALAHERVADWANRVDHNGDIDLQHEMVDYAMDVLTHFLFGHRIGAQAIARISHGWTLSLRYMNIRLSSPVPLPDWLPTPNNRRLHTAAGQIATVLLEIIAQHRSSSPASAGGFLDDLINYRDEQGQALDDQHILREIMGVFLAGFDTVASAMMWTLGDLAKHPGWQQAVRDELNSVATSSRLDLKDTPVLEQCFNESMRLSPPLWLIDRKAAQPCMLGGQRVPGGTNIIMSPWVTHRDPSFWERPLDYHPEHFAATAPSRPKYAFFPFGGGRMKCIGIGLAHLQLKSLLRQVLTHYELNVRPEHLPEIEPAFVLRTRNGLKTSLTRRVANGESTAVAI